MNEANTLLHAYYEVLHDSLQANRGALIAKAAKLLSAEIAKRDLGSFDEEKFAAKAAKLLSAEIAKRDLGSFDEEKFAAYRDACVAFIDERIETYNPIGIQYTFDRPTAREALELELQLNWYDSRAEFEALVEAARSKLQTPRANERIRELGDELIRQVGAYPNNTIISAFEAEPALAKLPDYVVARAIEEIIR